ncbi:hypothetical protein L6452_14891 [Arctium lappa]|uniref:Uncharacterized protein n=1 Tax=Arctium lappa TaxID=4217 RepID=A0ACB9CMH6_ARCLA|nr:hypothetical protein L6452_14891 [Arctium lappa]
MGEDSDGGEHTIVKRGIRENRHKAIVNEKNTKNPNVDAKRSSFGIVEKLLQGKDLNDYRDFALLGQATEPLLDGSDQILVVVDVGLMELDIQLPVGGGCRAGGSGLPYQDDDACLADFKGLEFISIVYHSLLETPLDIATSMLSFISLSH